jgi:formylglycine-generating enzyme required for sulfatase activity
MLLSEPGQSDFADIRPLLAAVPDDTLAALALADYLEERGDAVRRLQGELFRLVYALTRSVEVQDRAGREERLRGLLAQGVRAIGPYRRIALDDQLAMDFAWVPPGAFLMGSPQYEEESEPEEGPQHEVALVRGFWMGTTPVTQEQYERLMGRNPSNRKGLVVDGVDVRRTAPVEEVEWYDAIAFLKKLSVRARGAAEGGRFRLPTEAEWEYACRAGTTTRFWSGDGEEDLARVGWYRDNSRSFTVWSMGDSTTHPVAELLPNAFGLYDVHGNVWEWCSDLYDENYYARSPNLNPRCKRGDRGRRVIRGGFAWGGANCCRSATRSSHDQDCSHNDLGFRVVADRL